MKLQNYSTAALVALAIVQSTLALAAEEKKERSAKAGERDETIAVQVLLDRAGFSPGEIDGQKGKNFENVLKTYQQANNLETSGEIDEQTSAALGQVFAEPVIIDYTITEQDAAGPFVQEIPEKMEDKAKLPQLGYKDVKEMLGERFHVEPDLLTSLNDGAKFAAGEAIKVPNVEPFDPTRKPASNSAESKKKSDKDGEDSEKKSDDTEKKKSNSDRAAGKSESTEASAETSATSDSTASAAAKPEGPVTISLSKSKGVLTATDSTNRIVFAAPATTGSEHDPLPLGEWKVNGVERNPSFSYNPDLFWDAKKDDKKAKLPAGPNNPVGSAWIDLTKEHYGIHGTPEPGTVGHTESHGCVRLTNWDVMRLAPLAKPNTKVIFSE